MVISSTGFQTASRPQMRMIESVVSTRVYGDNLEKKTLQVFAY